MILEHFGDWMTQTVSIYYKFSSYNQSTGKSTITWVLSETLKDVGFFEGGAAERLVSERFRADISGVFIVNPKSLANSIGDDYKIVIGSRSFSVIHMEDIMLQGEVYVVPVKEFK